MLSFAWNSLILIISRYNKKILINAEIGTADDKNWKLKSFTLEEKVEFMNESEALIPPEETRKRARDFIMIKNEDRNEISSSFQLQFP
jgi:hypothetical protein